jgi:hypothetical protein
VEHEEQAQELEAEAQRLEEDSERVGGHIEETRRDWKQKERESSVPGAQPAPGEEPEASTGKEESDQLPEEGPAEQVPDDSGGESRDESERSPGVPGEDETATGNPDAAGSEDPDEED